MRVALILVALGFALMAVAVPYGFAAGGGREELRALWALPWGKVSFADVYVGFLLVCGWIAYRERAGWVTAIWVVLILTLGNLVSCLYVGIALWRARGDWRRFWLGARA